MERKNTHLKPGDWCFSSGPSLKCYDSMRVIFIFFNFHFLTCNTNMPFQVISPFLSISNFALKTFVSVKKNLP